MININIEKSNIDIDRQLRSDQEAIERAIKGAQSEVGRLISDYAKTHHRYTRRTGRLARATQYRTSRDITEVFINQAMAKYGSRIHEGSKGWGADPFIDEAVNANKHKIEQIVDRHLQRELNV